MRPTIQRVFLFLLAPLCSMPLFAAVAPAPTSPTAEVRYHFGDNPGWANPNFDDRSWSVAPDGTWPLPPFRSDGVVWVRFRVPVPAHPTNGLALRLSRPSLTEAAEQVFLDGTSLGHNGELPPAPEAVVLQNSTFAVAATIPVEEPFATVAVRLWYPPTSRYGGGEDSLRSRIGYAAELNVQQRADRLALILSWVPVISLNALLALVGVGLLGLWFWSRRRELLWFSLLLGLYPLSLSSLPVLMSPMFPSRISAELVALGNATSMFVTVEFLWIVFPLRNRWLRILLHSAWVAFNAAGLPASLATSGSSQVAWALRVATVAVSVFNLGTLFIDLRFLVTGPNRLVAAGMAVIPVASCLLFWLHLDPSDLFGIPHLDLFDTGFLLAGAFLSIMLIRRALAASRQGAHLRMELAAAREVQQNLVPATLPQVQGFRVEAAYLPAQEVGGDFFQILPQSDGSRLLIVGDVSGKGLKAAMTGTLALGAIRNMAQEDLAPSQILSRLNRQLAGDSNGGFITCLAALIASDGNLTLANAGHLPPYRNGEEIALESSLPLGIVPDATYCETIIQLVPDDRLVFISDGVVEAQSRTGELFGFERTREISRLSAEEIAHAAQSFGQEDDITVLSLAFAPVEALHA